MNFVMRSALLLAVTTGSACSIFWEVPATPLQDAAWRGDVAAIKQLVKEGADVNAADDMGATALYWAARGGHSLGPHRCKGEEPGRPEVIATLVELGADPNILSDQGMSVVSVAAAEGAPRELIALMMEKGFDPQRMRRRAD